MLFKHPGEFLDKAAATLRLKSALSRLDQLESEEDFLRSLAVDAFGPEMEIDRKKKTKDKVKKEKVKKPKKKKKCNKRCQKKKAATTLAPTTQAPTDAPTTAVALTIGTKDPRAGPPRHALRNDAFFHAVRTSSFSGQGVIAGWTADLEQNNGNSDFNPSTGIFTASSDDVNNRNYMYCAACMRCAQGSACEVSMRTQTSTRIATMANRDNQSSRFAQMCQAVVYAFPNSNTLNLYEEAGGGSPGNTKFDSGWRYAHFSCFSLRVSVT